MKLLFLGDVVGKAGMLSIKQHLANLKQSLKPDITVVNGENASDGNGLNPRDHDLLLESGANIITGGNHIWDRIETLPLLEGKKTLLRPENFPTDAPGTGHQLIETARGYRVLVINLQGQLLMSHSLDDPFKAADNILKKYVLKQNVDAILVDFHAEATSEKNAMGHYLDGRASFVIGTHTHIPTADHRILPKGTAYQTDAGMCGDYQSVIGFDIQGSVQRFLQKRKLYEYPKAAKQEASLCGAFVHIDDKTGLAKTIQPIRYGGVLDAAS